MEQFSIKGYNGHFEIELVEVFGFPDRTSPWGGYDVRGSFRIKINEYSAYGELWFSTGEIYQLYHDLQKFYDTLNGTVRFNTYEYNLEFEILIDKSGHITIQGRYIATHTRHNELLFEIVSDQSFVGNTLAELQRIVQKYGTKEGIE